MTRFFHLCVFAVGLALACWIGTGYVASNLLALSVTALVIVVYLAGALELFRYQQATSTLTRALAGLDGAPSSLHAWLDQVHPSLRNAVRLRVEGERVGLPGPALTPYLVGLLVLLGMLGTFLGMVATLRGTGIALESSTNLEAIRASLAAPVKGLGFAFGTSVAGVATSAMLGLLSALCRRERIGAAQRLDATVATTLRIHSATHRREESLKLLQRQADIMPAVVDRLQAMMTAMEQQNLTLNERLAASQDTFHGKTEAAYRQLALSVAQTLKESVADSARAATAAIQPAVESTMTGLTRETAALHDTVTQAVQRQLDGVSTRLQATAETAAEIWNDALAGHRHMSETLTADLRRSLDGFAATFEQRSSNLLDGVATCLDGVAGTLSQTWDTALTRHEQVNQTIVGENQRALTNASATFERHGASLADTLGQAFAQTASEVTAQTQAHASKTIAEIARLAQAVSEAPKAAAALATEVRQKFSDSMARDNAMLEERGRLLQTLGTLLDAVNHASTEQRSAVDALVATSAEMLGRVGTQFTGKVQAQTDQLAGVAAQVAASAVEVASLGDAFGAAVGRFSESNESLVSHLQRMEAALDKSTARGDEQLAYYVAQAREVIDLSMMAQKQIVQDLQQLADQRASATVQTA